MSSLGEEPTIESRIAFQGQLITVHVHKVRTFHGNLATREIVEHSDAVCIVPVLSNGNVLLVRQYRKAAKQELLEVPAGGIEQGESIQDAALREMQEETGYTAGTLLHLSSFWMAPGWSTEEMHAYLATDLESSKLPPDEDENIYPVNVPLADVSEMIRAGQIKDAKSITSLLLATDILGIPL